MFEERERAFEAKYRNDQEIAFRLHARRDKLFGHWVAKRLGYPADEAEAYAHSLVTLLEPHREASLLHKVAQDLDGAGKTAPQVEIARAFADALHVARTQMIEEGV